MKPSNKMRKRESREQRRLEWGAARAAFLLAGGHKDWIVPFHMNWRGQFAQMTSNLEAGNTYYTNPRAHHDSFAYKWASSARSGKSYIYNQAAYRK